VGLVSMSDDRNCDFVAFDLETTGLFAETDRIVELGAVRFDAAGREIERYQRLVNPERPMSPDAQAVHGLSDFDLAGEPPARDVLPEFVAFLGDPATTRLIAHNARFDTGFLGRELGRLGMPMPAHAVIDTLALARRLWPWAGTYRLDALAQRLDVPSDGAHRALADSLRVKALWLALTGGIEPLEPAAVVYPIADPARSEPAPLGWEVLVDAIARGLRVRIEYQGGTRGAALRDITPRRFAHRGGAVYLVAFCHLDAFEKSFRLDRVRRYEVVSSLDRHEVETASPASRATI
jgi:DNA polymerase III subunit epsilon